VKVEIGVGKGKAARDKREDLKKRASDREADREVARFNRGR
jgi:SsrA-binding protein